MVRWIRELRCSEDLLIGVREIVREKPGSFEKEMQKDLNELSFKSRMAESEKKKQSIPRFYVYEIRWNQSDSKQSADRRSKSRKEYEFPNKEV